MCWQRDAGRPSAPGFLDRDLIGFGLDHGISRDRILILDRVALAHGWAWRGPICIGAFHSYIYQGQFVLERAGADSSGACKE